MSRRPTRKRRPRPWLGWLWRLALVPPLLWLAGLAWFALTLAPPLPLATRTDGTVVLTGGPGRLARGLAVLKAGSTRHMLLSGVNRIVSRRQLAELAKVDRQLLETMDFGYQAAETRGNAEETAAWVARHRITSLRVVTAAPHMRRSLMELAQVLPPGVTVQADGVPAPLKPYGVAREYSKFLVRRFALWAGAQ
ncbi:MAG: YdcF family protein [Sphingomonadales bacterium]